MRMWKHRLRLTPALALLATSVTALAADPTNVSMTDAPESSRFHLLSLLQVSSSLHHLDSTDHNSDAGLLLIPSYRLTDEYKISAQVGVKQNLEHERETRLMNSKLLVSRSKSVLNPFMSLTPIAGITAATDKDSYQGDSLIGAAHLQPKLDVDFTRLGLSGLSLTYQLTMTRNFHRYTTSYTGKSNTELSLLNNTTLDYSFNDHFGVSAGYYRGFGWTYEGSPKNNFEFSESISYSPSEKLSISIGHSNSGAAYKENGKDSNIALFNPNDSSVFGYLTFSY